MNTELQIAVIAGLFGLGGIVVGAILTHVSSYLQHKREIKVRLEDNRERELAVFHGAFSVCNYMASVFNDWDTSRNIFQLSRLAVAQPYVAKLIDRSPANSERLMVSLTDLGLRLESLLFRCGFAIGSANDPENISFDDLESEVRELSGAVELVQLITSTQLDLLTSDDIAEIAGIDIAEIEETREGMGTR